MNPRQLRSWLASRLKEAEPLDCPSTVADPQSLAVMASKKLALTGYGSGALLAKAYLVDSARACAQLLADCIACLPNEEAQPTAMSVPEAAEILGVSKETVYRLCAEQQIEHSRIGRRITITPQQLADYQSR